ncbi:MAG: hypothetical protein JST82_07335 [Bacteroidetes bacterium]|nr:hypothetical protein [Bacteroidota bacterium]
MPKQAILQQHEKSKAPFDFNSLSWLLWLTFAIYIIASCYCMLNHEQWRDEAQSWLIARDNSITSLFKFLPSEGHPPLWYLLIMPLAKSGAAYASQKWLALLITIIAVYLLIFKSRLHFIVKILLPFSYFLIYEYSCFARSYCLVVLFAAFIIWLYPKRFEKPFLFALSVVGLFNVHVLTFSFALCLTLLYVWDTVQFKKGNRKIYIAIAMMLFGGLYLIPYLATSKMTGAFSNLIEDNGEQMMLTISDAMIINGSTTTGLLVFILAIALISNRTKLTVLLVAGATGIVYILGYKLLGSLRHEGILFVELITIYAIKDEYNEDRYNFLKGENNLFKYNYIALTLMLLLQLKPTTEYYFKEIDENFSDAENVANYLKEHHLEDKILVGHQAWATSAVLPYLSKPRKFFTAECERYLSYYINDSCYAKKEWGYPPDFAVDIAHSKFPNELNNIVFIFNAPLQERTLKYLDLLYVTPEMSIRKDESYAVYKFKPGVK